MGEPSQAFQDQKTSQIESFFSVAFDVLTSACTIIIFALYMQCWHNEFELSGANAVFEIYIHFRIHIVGSDLARAKGLLARLSLGNF